MSCFIDHFLSFKTKGRAWPPKQWVVEEGGGGWGGSRGVTSLDDERTDTPLPTHYIVHCPGSSARPFTARPAPLRAHTVFSALPGAHGVSASRFLRD